MKHDHGSYVWSRLAPLVESVVLSARFPGETPTNTACSKSVALKRAFTAYPPPSILAVDLQLINFNDNDQEKEESAVKPTLDV